MQTPNHYRILIATGILHVEESGAMQEAWLKRGFSERKCVFFTRATLDLLGTFTGHATKLQPF